MPEISIIVPIYNVERYLPRCLDSVLGQTFKDFEVICVNDGSPDGCAEILADYADRDSRIRVLSQPNQGLSMARNNGLKLASGEYIYFLDSDDALHPQCLEIVYGLAKMHQAGLVSFRFCKNTDETVCNAAYSLQDIKYKLTNNPLRRAYDTGKFCIHYNVWTKFYKRELLDGIEFIPHIHFEDFPHTLAVLSKKPKTVIIENALYFYTVNEASISNKSGTPQQIKDYHQGINYVFEVYNKPSLSNELRFIKYHFIPNILKHQFGRCRRSDATNRPQMFAALAKELRDLDAKGLFSWRGHKLKRWWAYRRLINGKSSWLKA